MQIFSQKTIRLFSIGFLCLFFQVFQTVQASEIYNPNVTQWIKTTQQLIKQVANTAPSTDQSNCFSKEDWITFQKSLLSYKKFRNDWNDLSRNDCLRSDLDALNSAMIEINQAVFQAIQNCSNQIPLLQDWYLTLDQHIQGLRQYGENAELEQKDNQACDYNPECNKALLVGSQNVKQIYANPKYTPKLCPLTQKKAQSLKAEWDKLKSNINLYKKGREMFQNDQISASTNFTEEDYATSKKEASNWWNQNLKTLFKLNSKQVDFRLLRKDKETNFTTSRTQEIQQREKNATATIPPKKDETSLIQSSKTQLEAYQKLKTAQESLDFQIDLSQWKNNLTTHYKDTTQNASLDLENILMNIANNVVTSTDYIKVYFPKLKIIVNKHCSNLYPAKQ